MDLANLMMAGYSIIQVVSTENMRVHAAVNIAAESLSREWYLWDRVRGLRKWDNENKNFSAIESDKNQPDEILDWFITEDAKNSILILEDFHPDLTDDKPSIIKRIRNIAESKYSDRSLILSQPFRRLPSDLEKDVHIIEMDLPELKDLKAIYKQVCNKFNITPENDSVQLLLEASLGLTTMEAERAFSKAYIERGQLTNAEITLIISEKENIIKKSGYLEYYHPKEKMEDIGGLENLKDWLTKRGRGFDISAREYGLDTPRGVLLLGIPGTGKSLSAKAIGATWNFPLLKLDMGKVFGGIVGESEKNIRESLKIAEAIAPSVLWIDEIEKGLSGLDSSGATDGGTTARVLGSFLTWMQEKTKPVFVVATANNISQLPPELLRKGRFDEIFFVDLPDENGRKEIISIHLKKKKRKPELFDIAKITNASKGFSGAELEEALKDALFKAFDDDREVNTEDILEGIKKTFPLSKTMGKTIEKMREWAENRAVFASRKNNESFNNDEVKDIPKLKQENYNNPFIS